MNIWRLGDVHSWKERVENNISTFEWFYSDINYNDINLDKLKGEGKRSIKRWVNHLKRGDLVFVMNKTEYYGAFIVETEYDYNRKFKLNNYKFPVIKVKYVDTITNPIKHKFKINSISPDTFSSINQYGFSLVKTLKMLARKSPKSYHDITNSIVEEKIARVCWNDNYWEYPSGLDGKSYFKESYERKFGYGHEEWMANKNRNIKGYIYGFLQPISKSINTGIGKNLNITLYSKHSDSKEYLI